jgi:PPOX class probable F420-dependent enzyme
MDESVMRSKVAEARVARVGTLDESGSIHLVPVVYVVDGDTWYSPSDAGPRPVKRLRNVLANPQTSILIDEYDEAWSRVWWVRLRGRGRMIESGAEGERARRLLGAKYPQFADATADSLAGPVMAVEIKQWTGWAYS